MNRLLLLIFTLLIFSKCVYKQTEYEYVDYQSIPEHTISKPDNTFDYEVFKKAFGKRTGCNIEKLSIRKVLKISPNCNMFLMEHCDSLCSELILVSLCDSVIIDTKSIGKNCDHDLSVPEHEWTEIVSSNERSIVASTLLQFVNDSFLIDFEFPPNKHFYDFPVEIDTLKTVSYTLDKNGVIVLQSIQ